MVEPPIFHFHVKVVDKRLDRGVWFARFLEPNGRATWMEQPSEPTLGDEQILYVIKKNTKEMEQLQELTTRGASQDELTEFVNETARKYDEWCESTWEETRVRWASNN